MKFEEVLPALREDKKVRRSSWGNGFYIALQGESPRGGELVWWDDIQNWNYYSPSRDDFNADDWEIVKEDKKVKLRDLTSEQYKKWYENNCSELKCEDCIFCNVRCGLGIFSWVKNKDTYSDKFLDQEIEIDE